MPIISGIESFSEGRGATAWWTSFGSRRLRRNNHDAKKKKKNQKPKTQKKEAGNKSLTTLEAVVEGPI
jgi:hypothetical protein